MEKKEKKAKRKINKTNVIAIVASVVACLGLVLMCIGLVSIIYLLKDKPELDLNDINSQESTIVLDQDDNQIYELGTVIRQNVEYDDLPESLIDAFISVEDSRFFEHNGFDLPRFVKALFANIKTGSFSQGASTFTMQLVKNTYFVDDESGTGAVKSIKRKVQEIALAMELEKVSSKKEIFVDYLNKLNFGGTYQNIRGIQKASQYYFGKDVNELTLPESAFLAGVIQAPNTFNPFNSITKNDSRYLQWANDRRDEVLYLMNYHGYITDEEYQLALQTKIENFLVDSSDSNKGDGEGTPYQAYIDAVVSEVYSLTGLDPYNTPMIIHTYMNKEVQELMDNIQAGNVDDYFTYPDSEFEVASICLNNKTGEVIGILGGRNYADGGALLLNHATAQFKQPGSSIKPILDYVQAFEVLGWSTSHCLVDRPLVYEGTNYIISNATNSYAGQVTLKYAVGMSLNTPAIDTIRQLIDQKGNNYLVDYLINMGFDIDLQDFDEQYAIGGKGLTVSCEQLAGAYAALMNNGYYTTPHTIEKIEFLNEKSPIVPSYQSTQTVSEQACFLMSEILKNDVEGGYPNLMGLFKNDNYTVYAKTGTTNWGSEGATYNIPNGSIKDGWVVGCTSEYTIATWMGYEKGQANKPSYMTYDVYNKNIKGKITKLLLDKTTELFGYPEDIQKPTGISRITHIIASNINGNNTTGYYAVPIDGMDEKYIVSGYIKSDSKLANLVSPKSATVSDIESAPSISLSGTTLKIEWPTYPGQESTEADDEIDISLHNSDGSVSVNATGGKLFDYTWVYGPVKYKADVSVGSYSTTVVSGDSSTTVDLDGKLSSGAKITVEAYYGYENGANSSSKKSADLTVNDTVTISVPSKATPDELKSLFSKYGTVNLVAVQSNTHTENEIKSITLSGTDSQNISLGDTITIHAFATNTFTVEYYTKIEYTITLTPSKSNDNKTLIITAQVDNNYSGTYKWSIDGVESSTSGKELTLDKDKGEYTVKCEIDDGTSQTIEVTID